MAASLRELFPFGDLDVGVIQRVGSLLPESFVEEAVAGLSLAGAAVEMLDTMPAPLADAGLTPARWRLLVALQFQAGETGATVGELAAHLGVREPTITASVSRAERDGHVMRHRDRADRRSVQVRLTPAGEEAIRQLLPVMAERVRGLVEALGGTEYVEEFTNRLVGALDAMRSVQKA